MHWHFKNLKYDILVPNLIRVYLSLMKKKQPRILRGLWSKYLGVLHIFPVFVQRNFIFPWSAWTVRQNPCYCFGNGFAKEQRQNQ